MEFILDTNAYRTLAQGKNLHEVLALAREMKAAEAAKNYKSVPSTTVTMELIKHLITGDPAMEVCYNALCLQVFHCSTIDRKNRTLSGDFIPAMNDVLSNVFFDKNSEFFPLYVMVQRLAAELAAAKDINVCATKQDEITAIRNQILFEINEFKTKLEELIASLNGGELNWKLINENESLRKDFYERLNNGDFIKLLAIALMIRAHQVIGKEELDKNAEQRLPKFIQDYEAALRMNLSILESVAGGATRMQDSEDKRWNTLNDVQIMMATLYSKDDINGKFLVTNEKKIKSSAQAANIGNRVLTVDEYLKEIGLAI